MRSRIVCAIALGLVLAAAPALAKPLQYVRDAQRLLATLGYHVGELDGEFDAEFEAALNHFKSDERLSPDGRFDAATREALNKAFAARSTRQPPSPRVVAAAPPVVMAAPAPGAAPQPVYPPPGAAQPQYNRVQPAPYPQQPYPAQPAPAAPPVAMPAPAAAPVEGSMITPRPIHDPFFGFVLEGAFEFGGDDVATVIFTDGTTQDVKTGQGVTLSVGGLYRTSRAEGFTLRGTAGYKFVSTKASNADIGIDRIVGELVGGWLLPSGLWLGAGPVYHGNIEFDGGGVGPDLAFDNAVGGTVELGWRWIAATYTFIDYTDEFGGEYDAGNAGLMFSYAFGR